MPNPQNVIGKGNRFKKGQSGNPLGRPKKLPELDRMLSENIGEEGIKKIVLAMYKRAASKGDVRAAELLFNRAYGKPKESVDLNFKDETKRVVTLPGGTTLEA